MVMKIKLLIMAAALIVFTALANAQDKATNQIQQDTTTRGIAWVDANNNGICDFRETGLVASENFSFSDTELDMLLHMKEEEKLARDVYAALYEKWGIPIFSNISRAENTHMSAVIYLLEKYGEEQTAVDEPGKFTNPDFQKLYAHLVTKGSTSLVEAFKTGALIEDMDIKDLMEFLDEVTNENIIMVFENLTKGSRNHLRAFNRQLSRSGIIYTPEYISQEEFDKIISSPHEAGNVYQRGRYGRPYWGRW